MNDNRPRVTRGRLGMGIAPVCPHCSGEMDRATVTLGDITTHWPLDVWIPTPCGGYAGPGDNLTIACPECRRLSCLAITDSTIKLVATLTEVDARYLGID